VLTVFVWGVAAFATVPGLQMRVVDQARESPTLVSTFNIAAFNLGNALGAWLGGRLIYAQLPLHVVPLGASAMALVAIAIAGFSVALERRSQKVIHRRAAPRRRTIFPPPGGSTPAAAPCRSDRRNT